jgi:plasmid replication initiation protein
VSTELTDGEDGQKLGLEGYPIYMNNRLTRAGHDLSVSEKKIILIAIAKLDSRRVPDTSKPVVSRVSAEEYSKITWVGMNAAYIALESAASSLFEAEIRSFEPASRRNGAPLTVVRQRWVERVKYYKGEGWIELTWAQGILPSLFGLKRNYTSFFLYQAGPLRSTYSLKLLELLSRWQSTGEAIYTIEDFCASMDCTEKQAANFNNIKRRIIEPAVKELCEKGGWTIEWEAVKGGRRVKELRFKFSVKLPAAPVPEIVHEVQNPDT